MPRRRPAAEPAALRTSQKATAGLLTPRSLELPEQPLPRVHVRASAFRPLLYKKMIERVEGAAAAGDLAAVIDRDGQVAGYGLYNPRSEIVLRMLCWGAEPPAAPFWQQRLADAVTLRRETLRLDEVTNAYRVVHAEGDALSGLVVDRYGDVLSAEIFSLGIFQRIGDLLPRLAALCGTQHSLVRVDDQVHGQEGFLAEPLVSEGCPGEVTIEEHGARFKVRFAGGHKTGFFCDQRENRLQLRSLARGRTVLDLCTYTGGFAVQAALGEAAEVTAVDLDETALETARDNARLNRANVRFVHADAFTYIRDITRNERRFDVVVLDPPKLIKNRFEAEDGRRKYHDLNRLAMGLVAAGGLMVSCSCSGLLSEGDFVDVLQQAARRAGRSVQILERTAAGADHPVAMNCPEGAYLKAVWMRLM